MKINRRAALLGGLGATVRPRGMAQQQAVTFFRIGTGGMIGTYFPVGGLIANAISNPPGSRACNDGGSCGVSILLFLEQQTGGGIIFAASVLERRDDTAMEFHACDDVARSDLASCNNVSSRPAEIRTDQKVLQPSRH